MTQRRLQIARFLILFPLFAGLFYQNCSQVKFAPTPLEQPQIAADTPLVVGSAEVKVSARNVPPLKLFFVVDNSFTMKQNQVNLSQSFQKMFAANNAKSLANFDTTAFLINTAQQVPGWAAPELQTLISEQVNTASLSPATYTAARSASLNSGAISGDIVGYKINSSANAMQFLPAPVLGFKSSGGGLIGSAGIHKLPTDDPMILAQDFQDRLALMDSSRIPLLSSGQQKYNSILDQESGLCAMARILRNSPSFINAGEQAAFVIVTDEEESDPAGQKCIESLNNVTQADDLIKGKCEERSTTLSYSVSQPGSDSCKISYQNGYKYLLTWNQDTVKTQIVYRKLTSSGAYSSPQTQVSYSKTLSTYSKLSTDITYYLKSCTPIIADGIKVGENCTYPKKTANLAGDWTAAKCAQGAQQVDAQALTAAGTYSPSCVSKNSSVASCAAGDTTCTTSTSIGSGSKIIDGTFSTQATCLNQAKLIAGAITDGSQPVTCTAASAKTGSGACPAALIALGCVQTSAPSYSQTTVTVNGDYTTSTTACYNQALAQTGAAIDSGANAPTCTKLLVPENKSATGTLAFNSTVDSGTTQALGSCGALAGAVLAQVKSGNSLASGNGACTLTSYSTNSNTSTITTTDCPTLASTKCSTSNLQLRACTDQFIAGTAKPQTTTLPVLTSDINCTDLCANQSQLCAPTGGVNITATTTIEEYFRARYGATTTCSAQKSSSTVSTFSDRLESTKASLCVGTAAKPQYIVQSGANYRLNELVVEHVAGSLKNPTGYFPKTDLSDYIASQSSQVFGAQKPMVSVFIRTAADGTGTGGSIGLTYEALALRMQGSVERITSPDYSSALTNLSQVIRARLERSFLVSGMLPQQQVQQVWQRAGGTTQWIPLSPALWSATGNSVTLDAAVTLDLNDELKFEFF